MLTPSGFIAVHRSVCEDTFNFRLIPNFFLTILIFSVFMRVAGRGEAAKKFSFFGIGRGIVPSFVVSLKTLYPYFFCLKIQYFGVLHRSFVGYCFTFVSRLFHVLNLVSRERVNG